MISKKIFELHADVCKALGHPLRIEVIDLLQEKLFQLTINKAFIFGKALYRFE